MTLREILTYIPAGLVDDVADLLHMIVAAPDSKAAVDRAKAAIVSDAADGATDAALEEALKAGSK